MDLKKTVLPLFVFILLFLFFSACSTPSWFPIKKSPPYKSKMKELLDKEVVILDQEEYVKVLNPKTFEGKDQPKYLYIPVNEYLSKRDTFSNPVIREEVKKEYAITPAGPSSSIEKGVFVVSSPKTTLPNLKKKVVIAHFNDRSAQGGEVLGDWVTDKLEEEVSRRSLQVLFIDFQIVKEFLEKKGTDLKELETPKTLHLLNEVFGIHALVMGELSGPYVFTNKSAKDKDEEGTASAILKIDVRLVDTFSGKMIKSLSANNPIIGTKEKGPFPEEKAKVKAIHLTLVDLGRSLSKELDSMDWFCRIAKVEDKEVYLNAGKLTGLKMGDVMEVFKPSGPGERGEIKGKVQISAFFGIDASMGRLIQGKNPDVNDILKLAKNEGT